MYLGDNTDRGGYIPHSSLCTTMSPTFDSYLHQLPLWHIVQVIWSFPYLEATHDHRNALSKASWLHWISDPNFPWQSLFYDVWQRMWKSDLAHDEEVTFMRRFLPWVPEREQLYFKRNTHTHTHAYITNGFKACYCMCILLGGGLLLLPTICKHLHYSDIQGSHSVHMRIISEWVVHIVPF